jgi:hypothetical protein
MTAIYIPSVTEVISFVNSRAFDDIPSYMMVRAQDRGTDVHAAAAAHLLGLWYDVDPAHEGYIRSLENWVSEYLELVIFVEEELVSEKYGFTGHPDALVRLRGDIGLTLIDWKTPKPLSLSWRLQLAGYRLLAEANGHKIARVASLRLAADGGRAKFDGFSKYLAHDQNVFLSALNVYKFYH